ncbi:MAG TPA: sigma factor-like helix-turn-helix DNA-binding protein, partial [Actinomycetales bacterium]
RMRRRRARPTVPLPEREPAERRDDHALTDVRLDVRAALATLPEHQRQALVLVDMHGMSVAEAAEVLDVAQGTVKSRCARGRAALAPLLRPDGAPGPARGNRPPPPVVPPESARTTPAPETEKEGRWTT